jgi:hypothetical protein
MCIPNDKFREYHNFLNMVINFSGENIFQLIDNELRTRQIPWEKKLGSWM